MTALLYYSISSDLTKEEIIAIDTRVAKNRQGVYLFVRKFPSNSKCKVKNLILIICLGYILLFSNVPRVKAMGLSLPSTVVVTIQPSYRQEYKVKPAPTADLRLNKILMLSTNKAVPLIYINEKSLYINEQLLKKLRAGNLAAGFTLVSICVVVYIMCEFSGVDGAISLEELRNASLAFINSDALMAFINPATFGGPNQVYKQPSSLMAPAPTSQIEITKPSVMPHQEFVDLTKEEKRLLPHFYDKIINVEGHPRLRIGFWQSKYKVGKHGAVHDLPYSIKKNGGTKTEKSEENALIMMQSIYDMPNRPGVQWFDQDDVTYQGETDREIPAVFIFDDATRVIAVFNKKTGDFITTCQLEPDEVIILEENHNFGGGEDWFTGKASNLPPEGTTPIKNFENDIMSITPAVDNSQKVSNSPLEDITPIKNFENDIMGITPLDDSQSNNSNNSNN